MVTQKHSVTMPPPAEDRDHTMAEEIEAKVRVDDPESVRRRLESLAGPGYGPVLETNRLFDDARHSLSASGSALRLRVEQMGGKITRTLLTFKGPRTASRLKRRPEFETSVSDSGAMTAVLAGLGYSEIFLYEKRRTTWQVPPCEVVLDELPHLGWFVEVEGPSEEEVLRVLAQVGLAQQPLMRDTYIGLLVADLRARGEDLTRAVF
jgi:adenylate cyclase, class 2